MNSGSQRSTASTGEAPPSASRVSVGIADNPDSRAAGAAAVAQALSGMPPGRLPDAALLLSTSRHDPHLLLAAVKAGLPEGVPVYGGHAVGIIGNDFLAYDGFQVGIALFWLVGARLDVFVERGLDAGEAAVGRRLFERLSATAFAGAPSLLLLYDSVNRTGGSFRLNMATSIIDHAFGAIAEDIPLAGAGLVGDMQCRSTFQWTGGHAESQTALLLAFSGAMRIEQVVMHGCRPASAYHRVTKAEGNAVLEIDGRPALEVIAGLLGPESGRTWRDYAFFVTLGVNKGARYGPFDPDAYANRMCMSVDNTRQALIMFEPDLRPGDSFQLMLRDIDFSYIGDSIRANLEKNAPRRPIFALYIDCAGRASAYSHFEKEEAAYVQAALSEVCPLLGFYSGVEVARVAGKPQALDWTGVLCLFYEREASQEIMPIRLRETPTAAAGGACIPPGAAPEADKRELLEALAYYKTNLDCAAGEQVRSDAHLSAIGRTLRQKDEGFRVLATLKRAIDVKQQSEQVYQDTLASIISSMAVDRAAVLLMDDSGGYRLAAAAGYPEDEKAQIAARPHTVPASFFADGFLIANMRDKNEGIEQLRASLMVPYFVAVPITRPGVKAMLLAGRQREMKPFYPPFDRGDVTNYEAIANFLASITDNIELYSDVQKMAASFRRFVPEAFLKILNRSDFTQIALGDQVARGMTVLVSDIRSFTTLSERMEPKEVFGFVNEFLAEVGPVVRRHDGFINKYLGDAIMALFETPGRALDAAVAMMRQIDRFNERRRDQGRFGIQIGAGVNTGDLMLGTIGEAERLEGSVLADAVNLCFRLESLTKDYGAQILTTDATLAAIPGGHVFSVRPVDLVMVKGKRSHVTLMEILDANPSERLDKKLATRSNYQAAFQSFEFGAYDEAARAFRAVAKLDPDDRAARLMMTKARKLAEGDAYAED